jgi:hypothetical protein
MKILYLVFFFSSLALASYEEHFPHYYEYCTGTQLKYQPAHFSGAIGGPGGHGFMYIHGLCKDYSKDYPQVIPCSEVKTNSFNHQGVGVSIDSDYANVAWVAVPGRDLTINGGLKRKAATKADFDAIAEKAFELKIFENVQMRPSYVSQHPVNSREHQLAAAIYSIGTDLAINLARDLRCVRIPVSEKALVKAADYLNAFNNQYYQKGLEYKWSMVTNNCSHLAINTAAAMGIGSSLKVDSSMIERIFHLAIPANAYLYLVDKSVLQENLLGKIKRSKTFKRLDYMPSQIGSLLFREEVYPENEMFITKELEALTLPRKNITKLLATPVTYDKKRTSENTDLVANAKKWQKKYSHMLESAKRKNADNKIIRYLEDQLKKSNVI